MDKGNALIDSRLIGGGRIGYIDALRGFAMVMVVFGHVLMTTFDIGGYDSVIGSIVVTFWMPLFFFISGYVAYKDIEHLKLGAIITDVRKKSFALLVPALIFFMLSAICRGGDPLSFMRGGFGGYWFTPVLLEMFLVYFCVLIFCRRTSSKVFDCTLILLSLVGVAWLVLFRGDGRWWTVLCLENFTKYFQFFAFGLLCKKYQSGFIRLMSRDYWRAGIIVLYIVCLILYFNDEFKASMPLVYKAVHDIVVRYAGLLVVVLYFLSKESYFNSEAPTCKLLRNIGRRTLDIYLLHYFFLPNMQYLKPWIEPTNMFVVQIAATLAIAGLVVGLCLLLSNVIRTSDTLAYWLFGAGRSKR